MTLRRLLAPAVSGALCLLGAATGAAPTAPAAATPTAPFTGAQPGFVGVARGVVVGRMKRLGLLPARPPVGFEERSDVKALLDSTLTGYLRQAGFEAVGPETYTASYDRIARQIGGIYDTTTGRPKSEQARAAADNARREWTEKDHLDGYALARIVTAKASFNRGYASWDSAVERSDGQLPPTLRGAFFGTAPSNGTLPAYPRQRLDRQQRGVNPLSPLGWPAAVDVVRPQARQERR